MRPTLVKRSEEVLGPLDARHLENIREGTERVIHDWENARSSLSHVAAGYNMAEAMRMYVTHLLAHIQEQDQELTRLRQREEWRSTSQVTHSDDCWRRHVDRLKEHIADLERGKWFCEGRRDGVTLSDPPADPNVSTPSLSVPAPE